MSESCAVCGFAVRNQSRPSQGYCPGAGTSECYRLGYEREKARADESEKVLAFATKMHMVLHEGSQRRARRLFDALGVEVSMGDDQGFSYEIMAVDAAIDRLLAYRSEEDRDAEIAKIRLNEIVANPELVVRGSKLESNLEAMMEEE